MEEIRIIKVGSSKGYCLTKPKAQNHQVILKNIKRIQRF
jgi:hypothetical protein